MADDFGRQSDKLNINLRSSAGAARTLTMTLSGTSSQLGNAAVHAGLLAEHISKAVGATKALSGWIGAIVSAASIAVAVFTGWKEKTKEIKQQIGEIHKQTAVFNAQAGGNKRLEGEAQIASTLEQQLNAAKKQETIFRKFPELLRAIKQQADAARRALDADIKRTFEIQQFDTRTQTGQAYARMRSERQAALAQAAADRQRALDELERNQEGLSGLQKLSRKQDIEDAFDAAKKEIEYNVAKPVGNAIGRTFVDAIADGIATAIQTQSLTKGFQALAGSLLIGLGEIMQMIGERVILASHLIAAAIAALTSLNPVASIAAGLGLIIAGGVLKGLGASIGGRSGGGGSGGYGGGGHYGSAATSAPSSYFGVLNPAMAGASTMGLTAVQPVNINNPVFIGTRDPSLQRQVIQTVKFALQRGGV